MGQAAALGLPDWAVVNIQVGGDLVLGNRVATTGVGNVVNAGSGGQSAVNVQAVAGEHESLFRWGVTQVVALVVGVGVVVATILAAFIARS